jgi:hypothetical protein
MRLTWAITGITASFAARLAGLYFFIWSLFFLKGIVPIAIEIGLGAPSVSALDEPFGWCVAGYFLYWLVGQIGNWMNGYCNYQADTITLKIAAEQLKREGVL